MRIIDFLKNNHSQKLLTGILALVLVAGMTTPAFAGFETPQVEFEDACPDDCERLAWEVLIEEEPFCESNPKDQECLFVLQQLIEICIDDSSERFCPIGGTVGSMSTTSLLVAGAQANMGLWSLALVGIVGAAAAITYKVKLKKDQTKE